MPDGDRVHGKLAGRYQKVYKQLCEGHFSEEDMAHDILLPVKEELQRQGEAVIGLIDKIAVRCDQIVIELAVGNRVDWDKEALIIEKQAQRIYAKQSARDLVARACKEQLQDIRQGSHDLNFTIEMMRRYMWKLYEAKFQAIVPLKKKHHNDADAGYVQARLEGMRPFVWESLLGYARQAMERHSFKSLRRSPRRRQKFGSDNLDIDLTATSV